MAESTPDPAPEFPQYPNLATALAAFQMNLPSVRKGNTAKVDSAKGSYSYDYADLADVSDAVLPPLGRVGLAWITMPSTLEDGTIVLTWRLIHGASGDSLEGSVPVGRKGDRWQDLGGALTYARRYTLVSVTGVAPGGDDNDGRGANAGAGTHTQGGPPPVQAYLPVGLYDLASIDSASKAEDTFYAARSAGHLGLLVETPEGAELPFAEWLRAQAAKYPRVAPEDEPKVEADDAEAAEAAAVAAHEAELAREAAKAAGPTAREEAEVAMREQGA